MTVFKAKGLEYEYVYLPACVDEVWGESSRNNINKLTLPANLAPIRHAGASQDERLRIFFVAITRAKRCLYMTSRSRTYDGKATKRLKYLNEHSEDGASYVSSVLPKGAEGVLVSDHQAPALLALENNWRSAHLSARTEAPIASLLSQRLSTYQLSPTHLNNFIDIVFAGPEAFYFDTILRFPSAPSSSGQFGNAIHETIEWYQQQINTGHEPSTQKAIKFFVSRMQTKYLTDQETKLLIERGTDALKLFFEQRSQIFKPGYVSEHSFRQENVFVDDVHMAGKIDLLAVDQKAKTIQIVDFKTGGSYSKWQSDTKLHKYRQQLYCYKILVERSRSFKDYTVTGARLEFIEPDNEGQIHHLELDFNPNEQEKVEKLIQVVWKHIKNLDFPDTGEYPPNLTGIRAFEEDLLQEK
jgi:DNA helicase-2/ATP-dependent DNA helicase PcrA